MSNGNGPDSQGRRQHSSGTWNGNTSLTIDGGMSMHFEIKNLNVVGTTIKITANNNDSKEAIILPQSTVDLEFAEFGPEPKGWGFDVETDSDAFLVGWKLYSSWIPGDPNND
jgi:hypothetical protein